VLESATTPLLELLAHFITSQTILTLRELFQRAQLSGLDLDRLQTVSALCRKHNLEFIPPLTRGDLDSPRKLRFRPATGLTHEAALEEIAKGESQTLEFKSSLWFDRQRAESNPEVSLAELKSELVLHSALKSIAAMMNTSGGILYLGVRDDGRPIGLEPDYAFLKPEKRDPDGFELVFRDLIKDRFYRGNGVNDCIEVRFIVVGNGPCTISRIEVVPGPQLAFLRGVKDPHYHLYRRQGNRTTEVRIEEFEDFLLSRRRMYAA